MFQQLHELAPVKSHLNVSTSLSVTLERIFINFLGHQHCEDISKSCLPSPSYSLSQESKGEFWNYKTERQTLLINYNAKTTQDLPVQG